MNYSVRLRPELEEDPYEAFAWHEGAATGLGHEFLRSLFIALAATQRDPLVYRKVFQDFRRVLLDRFPYPLYFRVEHDVVVIFLLIHGARNPALIRRSLRTRKNKPVGS